LEREAVNLKVGSSSFPGSFLLIDSFLWDVVRNHTNRYNEMLDLHSFRKVYVRTPLVSRLISINSRPSCKGYPEEFHWISVPLRTALDFMDSCLFYKGYFAIHGASETCLDAAPLDQGRDGTEIKYFANCDEGRGAAGSALCP
jgi:hypothetical protein